ncbi:hypothetical protein Tco_0233170 [Tanacetum coccineum]
MSQNPNEQGHFTNLFNLNPSYQQETGYHTRENEADHIEAAKITFAAHQSKGRKFQLEHAWRILKGHSKWDAPKPLDTEDYTEIFGPDTRPRPAGKT